MNGYKNFIKVVDSNFLEKYGDRIRPEFGIVGKDGRVDMQAMWDAFDTLDGKKYPNRFEYALIHGCNSLMSSWDIPGRLEDREDEIYKACLEKDLEWKELLDYKEPQEDILL